MAKPAGPPPPAGQFGPDIYAAWRSSSLGAITEALELSVILDLAGPLAGRSALDAGCGDGSLALALARHGAAHVSGFDLDPRMVARAQAQAESGPIGIGLTVARSEALPYADQSFDVVTCVAVLAFVPDPEPAIRELARVLRPGGRLVIGDLGKWSCWALRRRMRGWFGAALWRGARFRTAAELATLIGRAGLRIDAIRGAVFFPPWTALARRMAPFDRSLGDVTTVGAAFVAIQATKAGLATKAGEPVGATRRGIMFAPRAGR